MRCKYLAIITIIALLLLLAGCGKAECKKDEQCTKAHYTGKCVDKKCVYEPIPNECGNGLCEKTAGENKCSCPLDCGDCTGKLGKYLVQTCNKDNTECVSDIPAASQKPITLTKELTTGGTKISLTTTFNQPFNTKKDQFGIEFGINVLASTMSDIQISRLELTGMTSDKRTIPLADKTINKNLFEGGKVRERMIIDFPTADKDGEFTNLLLKIYLDYVLTSGTTKTPKSVTLQNNYQSLKFAWAMPEKSTGCTVCEKIPGMNDECGPQTNYFCEYKPIPGACGNGVCDGTENKCNCPADCGPCSGGGTYTTMNCVANNCVIQLKSGISINPQSLFDDKPIGPFHLQNTYKYNNPFNTKTDKFVLDLKLQDKQDTVSSVKITDVRLLDGSQEIAFASVNKELTSKGQQETAEITIMPGPAEQDRTLTLRVWYEYVQNGETKSNDFTKSLGKISIVSPDA